MAMRLIIEHYRHQNTVPKNNASLMGFNGSSDKAIQLDYPLVEALGDAL